VPVDPLPSTPDAASSRRGRPAFLALAIAAVLVLATGVWLAVARSTGDAAPTEQDSAASARAEATKPSTTTTEAPTTTTEPPPSIPPPPAPPPMPATVYVLGDSVTLGAQATIPPALDGWDVTFDARQNRRIEEGASIVESLGGRVGRVFVLHLCTNWGGGDYRALADRIMGALQDVQRVVWMTCTPWNGGVGGANAVIRALPDAYPQVVVAHWDAISGSPGFTYSDGLHLRPAGAAALASLVDYMVGAP
jgi:hypothetical protein